MYTTICNYKYYLHLIFSTRCYLTRALVSDRFSYLI